MEARAAELDRWEARLISQQQEYEKTVRDFREAMSREAAQLQAAAIKLAKRETQLNRRAAALLRLQHELNALMKQHLDISAHALSPTHQQKRYEGPVMCGHGVSSYVESLSSDASDEDPTSPVRQPSLIRLTGDDAHLQPTFDDAVEKLREVYSDEEVIEKFKRCGSNAREIISLANEID